ncbi:hypothetical protein [Arthrobacter sp. ISL-72]|uniref:MmyB family transcriptional regulator n=1 Tax=Arthrobacter sp. ISL-72 TaxID=2819114 RepID=UPI00288BE068|nr:hypothetical protein [Arthrobacter sp. ISL-72]
MGPQIQRLLDQLTDTPAFVVGKYLDILAWNGLAAALLADVDKLPPRERNYVRMMFTDPRMKNLYEDWESMARTSVAILRMQALDNPHDPRLSALVGELSLANPQFRQWWGARHVTRPEFRTKTIRHPELGDLTVNWDSFQTTGDPDQQLVLWTAEPGSAAHGKIRILASWILSRTHPTAAERNY